MIVGLVNTIYQKTNGNKKIEAFSEWLDDCDFGDCVSYEAETVYA